MLQSKQEDAFNAAEHKIVFGNISQIIAMHKEIYLDMKKAWSKNKTAGSIISVLHRSVYITCSILHS